LMFAFPADTTPPTGCAYARVVQHTPKSDAAKVFNAKSTLLLLIVLHNDDFLPALRAFSDTAIKVPVLRLQIDLYMRFMLSFLYSLIYEFNAVCFFVSKNLEVFDQLNPETTAFVRCRYCFFTAQFVRVSKFHRKIIVIHPVYSNACPAQRSGVISHCPSRFITIYATRINKAHHLHLTGYLLSKFW